MEAFVSHSSLYSRVSSGLIYPPSFLYSPHITVRTVAAAEKEKRREEKRREEKRRERELWMEKKESTELLEPK